MTSAKAPISTIMISENADLFKINAILPQDKSAVIYRGVINKLYVKEKTKRWIAIKFPDDIIGVLIYDLDSNVIKKSPTCKIDIDFNSNEIDVFFAIKDTGVV